MKVTAFVDNNANLYAKNIEGISIISPYMLKKLLLSAEIDMVLVPSDRMISYGLREYTAQLDKLNINAYKIVPAYTTRKEYVEDSDIEQVKEIIFNGSYRQINQLQHLQFHVIDNCNLNCKSCQHFSNIAEKNSYADFETLKKDFTRLRELFDDIGTIAILGGEPLLNPELPQYIKMVRQLFKYSRIEVITNGILVRQMNNELIEEIKNNDVLINISYYPILENSIEKIADFLLERGVKYHIGSHIDSFFKRLVEEKNDCNLQKKYEECRDACCTTLRNHKIYPCYLPATVHILNNKMGTTIASNECGIDIFEENIKGIDIVNRLKRYFDVCSYCGQIEAFGWEQTEIATKEDWIV